MWHSSAILLDISQASDLVIFFWGLLLSVLCCWRNVLRTFGWFGFFPVQTFPLIGDQLVPSSQNGWPETSWSSRDVIRESAAITRMRRAGLPGGRNADFPPPMTSLWLAREESPRRIMPTSFYLSQIIDTHSDLFLSHWLLVSIYDNKRFSRPAVISAHYLA